MAKFNPEVSVQNQNNFVNASQGQVANKGLGALFGTLADTISVGLEEKDNRDRLSLARAADEGVQQIDEETIGEALPSLFNEDPAVAPTPKTGTAAREPDGLPPSLTSAKAEARRISVAFQQGKISDLTRLTRLAKLGKNLRTQYPQYRENIEDILTAANGTTANRIREEVNRLMQAEAASKDKETTARQSIIKDTREYLTDEEALLVYKKITGKDMNVYDFDTEAWQYAVGIKEKEVRDIELQKKRLELKTAQDSNYNKEAKGVATEMAIKLRDRMLYTTLNSDLMRRGLEDNEALPTSLKFNQINQIISTDMADDGKMTPENQQAVTQLLNQIESGISLKADELLTGMDSSGFSFAKAIPDAKDREEIKAIIMAPVQTLKNAILNEQYGVIGAVKRDTEARKEFLANRFLAQDGGVSNAVDLASKYYGADVVNNVMVQLATDPTMSTASDEDKAVANKIQLMLLAGDSPVSILDAVSREPGTSPKAVMSPLQNYMKLLADPTASSEQISKAAKVMFSEKENRIISDYALSNPDALFNDLMTAWGPVSAKGDAESKSLMYSWGLRQANVILKPLADQIYDTQKFSDSGEIRFDPASQRFVFGPSATAGGTVMRGPLLGAFDKYRAGMGNSAVTKMNNYLDKMQPIVEANGDSLEDFLGGVFVGREFKAIQKEGSILTRMRDSFFGALDGSMKNPKDGEGGGDTSPPPLNPNPPGPQGSVDSKTKGLLSFISSAEGADYSTMYGGRKVDLGKKTVSQVLAYNKAHGKRTGSSATGAYQVMHDTLKGLIRNGVVKEDELFTEEVQDRLAVALLNEKGYQDFLDGKLSVETFANRVAGVWASLPLKSGKSKYHGDKMNNKATVSRAAFIQQLKALRENQA